MLLVTAGVGISSSDEVATEKLGQQPLSIALVFGRKKSKGHSDRLQNYIAVASGSQSSALSVSIHGCRVSILLLGDDCLGEPAILRPGGHMSLAVSTV